MEKYHNEGILIKDKAIRLMKKYFRFEKSFNVLDIPSKLGKFLRIDNDLLSYRPKSLRKSLSGWGLTNEYISQSLNNEKIYYYEISHLTYHIDIKNNDCGVFVYLNSGNPGMLLVENEDQAVLVCEFFYELLGFGQFERVAAE